MSSSEREHLIKMINQIADNFATAESADEQAQNIANHVKKFWAPSMISAVALNATDDKVKLQPVVLKALGVLGT